MASGTLYSYAGSHRAFKILIAAAYSGANVKVAENFEFGKTNTTQEFKQKFPLGKVPAFEDSNGQCLYETNAIARYVSNDQLKGGSNSLDQALVEQYISFSDNEILPSACAWTFPTLGFKQYNKQESENAKKHIEKCLELLNNLLLSRTFLVGERITLADITLCCDLLTLYVQVLEPKFREPYGNVNRWFLTCINQPNFKKYLGDVKLCEKMATFDNKRYQELHPKQAKGGKQDKSKDKKTEKPKEQSKPKQQAEPEAAAPKDPPKKIDYFADVPKSSMVLDVWKKEYSNEEYVDSMKWFWENYDPNAYSLWHCSYKYNDENTMTFLASNLISGFYQRIEGLHKHSFGVMYVTKHESDPKLRIHGVWLHRGLKLPFSLNPDWNNDAEHYDFRQLDHANADDKKLINDYFTEELTGCESEVLRVFK